MNLIRGTFEMLKKLLDKQLGKIVGGWYKAAFSPGWHLEREELRKLEAFCNDNNFPLSFTFQVDDLISARYDGEEMTNGEIRALLTHVLGPETSDS